MDMFKNWGSDTNYNAFYEVTLNLSKSFNPSYTSFLVKLLFSKSSSLLSSNEL